MHATNNNDLRFNDKFDLFYWLHSDDFFEVQQVNYSFALNTYMVSWEW